MKSAIRQAEYTNVIDSSPSSYDIRKNASIKLNIQDWSEAKKRILKCSDSDLISDTFFI